MQQWPSPQGDTSACRGGSLRTQRPPPTGSGISPPKPHIGSRASAGRHDAGHLGEKHTAEDKQLIAAAVTCFTAGRKISVPSEAGHSPLQLK